MTTITENADRAEALKKLSGMIKSVRIAMMTTTTKDDCLRSRPMATQETPFENDEYLWFFTSRDSGKVEEIEEDHQVNLAYSSTDDNTYVSISGRASTVRDQNKIDELWSPMLKAWFPAGKDDPQIALLRVAPEQAEYWEATSSRMVILAGMVKAVATGESFQPGENKKIDLES